MKEEDLQHQWEKRLAAEGMPAELPSDAEGCLDTSSGGSAARAYAELRGYEIDPLSQSGEHIQFVEALSQKFGVSKGEAQELVENAFTHFDRRQRDHGRRAL